MTRVILDEAALSKLLQAKVPAEVYDETGRLRGSFRPATSASLCDNVGIPFTDGELAKRDKEAGGRSLTEIMAELGTKEPLFTEEDVQLAEKQIEEGKFFTTAEVLAHLGRLEKP
jgi:hypothetical protein